MFTHDTQKEIVKIQYKNKHHEKLEKTKKYKTVEFDLIPVLFEERYKKTENYIKCNDSKPEHWPYYNYNIHETNISKYYICPDLTSSFIHDGELEEEEIIKIIRTLKEILEDVLRLKNLHVKSYGFIKSIIFKNYRFGHCVFRCVVKISENYFSKEAEYYTKRYIICKKLLEKGYEEENFFNYFNRIDDYFKCLLENVFGYCSSHVLIGDCSDSIYDIIFGSAKSCDQIQYIQSMILVKKYEERHKDIKNNTENIYLVLKKLGFIFKDNDEDN